MNVLHRSAFVGLIALAAACGAPTPTPASNEQPPATGGPITITGGERLGWTETGNGADGFIYAAYVDGVRNELQAACTESAPAVYDCESPLPPMTHGTHTLELSAAIRDGSSLIEGPRSAPIVVNVTGSGTRRIVTVSPEFAPATAIQRTPHPSAATSCGLTPSDSTHLIAWTSAGEVQLIDVTRRVAQRLDWPAETDASWRIAALGSRLEGTSRIVYAALTSVSSSEKRLRVLRYRELNGVAGERAVIAEGELPDDPVRATASFGPDGRVFFAFAWASTSNVPRPFVAVADPSTPAPLDFDGRFMAEAPVAGAWDQDGRFWIVERSWKDYTIRTIDTGPAHLGNTAAVVVGIQPIASLGAASVAVFASDGSGWLVRPTRTGAATQVDSLRFLSSPRPLDAVSLSDGSAVVGCVGGTGLTLTVGTAPWRQPIG